MKTTIKDITPSVAKLMLDKHLNSFTESDPTLQRKLKPGVVSGYARAMRSGTWGLTHQGIAIDDNGFLVDGQHRLEAIVESGVTITLLVTTGVPSNGDGTSNGVSVIDMIDRGSPRSVGDQLYIRHGVKDANNVAAIVRQVLMLCAETVKIPIGKMDVGMSLRVLDLYGDEISESLGFRGKISGLRGSPLFGAIAFAMKGGDKQIVREFAKSVKTGEGLYHGDPALTLRNYLQSHTKDLGGGTGSHRICTRATLTACMHAELGNTLKQVKNSEVGYTYYVEKQRRTITKLLTKCGFILR